MRAARRLSPDADAITLIGMTDPERLSDPLAALAALPRGSALIWRTYDEPPAAGMLRRLAAHARARKCLLLLAGHPRTARRLGTHGLHLPERALSRRFENGYLLSRRDLPPSFVVTAACHSERAIVAAARAGVDAVLISPVFATASHPGGQPLGVMRFAHLARLARSFGMEPYALGGIATADSIRRLSGSTAAGVAGISLLMP
ncbi:thiamine monophosphate synthase [Parvibaculum lavamentivorans DS-1]|uniref:Thiamine monophosphate synthase n=1 Tax=Parvibaculum lavamentivorans (strain DS-1 / DSM 13023 / NCIMB 13966) TaxID=402881 RepID=A7HSM1_PARL1|nr:thiamine monophosphate synthase [Parvibaculum lavamentivorans DS-1]